MVPAGDHRDDPVQDRERAGGLDLWVLNLADPSEVFKRKG
jgi:hypothetical protein